MPNGSTHAKATVALSVAGGFLTYHYGHPLPQVLALTGGALLGLVLTPDLDVDSGCISFDIVRRTTNRKIEHLWAWYWRPYSLIMPHRSKLSHFPVIGTTVRLVYLAILPALIWWFAGLIAAGGVPFIAPSTAGWISNAGAWVRPTFPAWGWWVVGGLMLADTLHFVMDQIF